MKHSVKKINRYSYQYMKRLLTIVIFVSLALNITGQEVNNSDLKGADCKNIVSESVRLFESGLYDQCIGNLENALTYCELSKADKLTALELLARAYIETGDPDKADATINILLHNYPHYNLDESSNYEQYNRLVKKYIVHPVLSIGIRNTVDWIRYPTRKVYSVLDGLDYSVSYNQNYEGILHGFNFMYYGWGELEFDKGYSLNGELTLKFSSYSRTLVSDPGFFLNFSEKDNFLEIPVYVKKYLKVRKDILPYVTAGIGWLYLAKARGNVVLTYTTDDLITGKNEDYSGAMNNIDMLNMRNRNLFEVIVGTGLGYKIKNLRLFIDARCYIGLTSLTNAANRTNNQILTDEFFYIDNTVTINQFELGASVSYTLFNSVKKSH